MSNLSFIGSYVIIRYFSLDPYTYDLFQCYMIVRGEGISPLQRDMCNWAEYMIVLDTIGLVGYLSSIFIMSLGLIATY